MTRVFQPLIPEFDQKCQAVFGCVDNFVDMHIERYSIDDLFDPCHVVSFRVVGLHYKRCITCDLDAM